MRTNLLPISALALATTVGSFAPTGIDPAKSSVLEQAVISGLFAAPTVGSLTVLKHSNTSPLITVPIGVAGVEFTLARVVDSGGVPLDLNKISKLPDVAHALTGFAYVATTDATGAAVFTGLPLGVYLLTESKTPSGLTPIVPVVLTVPYFNGADLVYNYPIQPKNELPQPTVSPTPTPTVSPTPTPTVSPTVNPTITPTPTPTSTPSGTPTPMPSGSVTPSPDAIPTDNATGNASQPLYALLRGRYIRAPLQCTSNPSANPPATNAPNPDPTQGPPSSPSQPDPEPEPSPVATLYDTDDEPDDTGKNPGGQDVMHRTGVSATIAALAAALLGSGYALLRSRRRIRLGGDRRV